MDRWEVEFCRFQGRNPVVEELQALRAKDVRLATEVVQDLKDLEEFGLALPEKRLHKIKGTDLWELRTLWQHRIARSLFFEAGGRLLVVATIFLSEEGAGDSAHREEAGAGADGPMVEGAGSMKLSEFINEHVRTDPEWAAAYNESELRRESARLLARARREQGISQAELAERCGTDQAVISRIERGVVSPSLDTLWRVAAGLGMRPVLRFEAMPEPATTRRRIPGAGRPRARVGPKETALGAAKASGSERITAKARATSGKAVGRSAGKVPTGAAGKASRVGTKAGRPRSRASVDASSARQGPS